MRSDALGKDRAGTGIERGDQRRGGPGAVRVARAVGGARRPGHHGARIALHAIRLALLRGLR